MRQIKGLNKTLKDLQNASKEVLEEVAIETEIFVKNCVVDAKVLAPVDNGKLKQNINGEIIDDFHYLFVAREKYSPFIEFGTGTKVDVPAEWQSIANEAKGKSWGSFDEGLENIKLWCKRKGIDEKAAYPIFLKILKVGINPQPFMYPAFIKNRGQYIKNLKKLVKRK